MRTDYNGAMSRNHAMWMFAIILLPMVGSAILMEVTDPTIAVIGLIVVEGACWLGWNLVSRIGREDAPGEPPNKPPAPE